MIKYLDSVRRQFAMYKQMGDKAMAQVSDDFLNWQANDNTNSIAVIVKHMRGNMLSRWTDFLTTDGEKPWRERDNEFEEDKPSREVILQRWEEGWKCLFDALNSITDDDLEKIIYIRNEGHTVLEAINRQVSHYCGHVGQIVYAAKIGAGDTWKSLSIPRNQSKMYNEAKFSQEKTQKHFTDEWIAPASGEPDASK